MLLAEAQKLDIYTVILDGASDAPCAQICNEFHHGDLLDYDTVYRFGKKVDLLTIEIERVNIDALETLESEGLPIFLGQKIFALYRVRHSKRIFTKIMIFRQPILLIMHF